MLTLADRVAALIEKVDAERPRSQQVDLGISGIGGCRRSAVYRRLGHEPTDPAGHHPAAMLGTWLHAALLPLLAAEWGGQTEVPVTYRGIPGSVDLYLPDEATVIDLKTVGAWSAQAVKRNGMRIKDRWQTHGYAAALREAGHPVHWVGVIYLNRENGEIIAVSEPFDPDVLAAMDAWIAEVDGYSVDDAPRDEQGPGLSVVCDGCVFRSACWPYAQATLVAEGGDPVIADMLARYEVAAEAEKAAKADKEFARAVLDGTEPGTYGGFALRWVSTGSRIDTKAAERLLTNAGLDVPRSPAGRRIDVKRA